MQQSGFPNPHIQALEEALRLGDVAAVRQARDSYFVAGGYPQDTAGAGKAFDRWLQVGVARKDFTQQAEATSALATVQMWDGHTALAFQSRCRAAQLSVDARDQYLDICRARADGIEKEGWSAIVAPEPGEDLSRRPSRMIQRIAQEFRAAFEMQSHPSVAFDRKWTRKALRVLGRLGPLDRETTKVMVAAMRAGCEVFGAHAEHLLFRSDALESDLAKVADTFHRVPDNCRYSNVYEAITFARFSKPRPFENGYRPGLD